MPLLPADRIKDINSQYQGIAQSNSNVIGQANARYQDIMSIYGLLRQVAHVPTVSNSIGTAYAVSQAVAAQKATKVKVVVAPTYLEEDSSGVISHYFFDAVLSTTHTTRREVTSHPVQYRASLTDHSYQLPAEVSLDIGMSDVMDTWYLPSVAVGISNNFGYGAGNGKSVRAYQKFVSLQMKGTPFNLYTKLQTYKNMIIVNITATDDFRTNQALRCRIDLREIFIGKLGEASRDKYINEPSGTVAEKTAQVKSVDDGWVRSIGLPLLEPFGYGGRAIPNTP